MPGMQNEWWAQEKKRNMVTLTPQFKIKHSLEQVEFVRHMEIFQNEHTDQAWK